MGNVQHKGKGGGLTAFQRKKLKYEFYTFFDLNHDGFLTYNDFLWAKDKICFMSGWKIDSPKYKITEALFAEIWDSLRRIADKDQDGKISKAEWLAMWALYKKEILAREKEEKDFLKNYYRRNKAIHDRSHPTEAAAASGDATESQRGNNHLPSRDSEDWSIQLDSDEEPISNTPSKLPDVVQPKQEEDMTVLEQFASSSQGGSETVLPKWLYKYLVFRFNLLDRTGDNVIDNEEFEYVLSEFGISEKVARQAFTIFTENRTKVLDFDYFVELFEEYYLSDDPSALGNFINGKLDFGLDEDSEREDKEEDPGRLDHRDHHKSSTSIHSMDDDLQQESAKSKKKKSPSDAAKTDSTIRLHEMKDRICNDFKTNCCALL